MIAPYVSFEHALSGPGLLNLYRAICELSEQAPTLTVPSRGDRRPRWMAATPRPSRRWRCSAACSAVSSATLVLLYGARGGVFLAGGILPQIRELLLASNFRQRFFNKGVMRAFLQQVPVRLMEHGQLGVIGAAGLYLDGQHDKLGGERSTRRNTADS